MMCSKVQDQRWLIFSPSCSNYFHLRDWLKTLLWYTVLLKEFTSFPASILKYCPLGPEVDCCANWAWLKQDVHNLFVPSVSGLWYWTALIAVMVHYISDVFHPGENRHVPYMKTILIGPLALKLGGHLLEEKARESRHFRHICTDVKTCL